MIYRRTLMTAVLCTGLLLGGCGHLHFFHFKSSCSKPKPYANARELPPLRIPTGLDAPDTRSALRIPELNEPEAPRGPKDPCLEEPVLTTPAPAAR